jgi:RimJ/RimL family protein N-acetyltransferase
MRDVTFQDSEVLLEWRNLIDVRMSSRNSDLIPIETHSKWFNNRLKLMPNQPFWVFENSLGKIGFIRFDFNSTLKHYEISVLINPALRGKGFGKMVLHRAIESFLAQDSESNFFAEVHINNPSSKSLFLSCGFQEFGHSGDFLAFKRTTNHD